MLLLRVWILNRWESKWRTMESNWQLSYKQWSYQPILSYSTTWLFHLNMYKTTTRRIPTPRYKEELTPVVTVKLNSKRYIIQMKLQLIRKQIISLISNKIFTMIIILLYFPLRMFSWILITVQLLEQVLR